MIYFSEYAQSPAIMEGCNSAIMDSGKNFLVYHRSIGV